MMRVCNSKSLISTLNRFSAASVKTAFSHPISGGLRELSSLRRPALQPLREHFYTVLRRSNCNPLRRATLYISPLRRTFTKTEAREARRKPASGSRVRIYTCAGGFVLAGSAFLFDGESFDHKRNKWITLYLAIVSANLAVYFSWRNEWMALRLFRHFTLNLTSIRTGAYAGVLLHGFTHLSAIHLFFNMLALYFAGELVNKAIGTEKLLAIFGGGMLASGLASLLQKIKTNSYTPSVGASGAVLALLYASAYYYPNTQFYVLPFPVPIEAWELVLLLSCLDLIGLKFRWHYFDHAGHLGGGLAGLAMAYAFDKLSTDDRRRRQQYWE